MVTRADPRWERRMVDVDLVLGVLMHPLRSVIRAIMAHLAQ